MIAHKVCVGGREEEKKGSEEPISPWTDADCNQPSLDGRRRSLLLLLDVD